MTGSWRLRSVWAAAALAALAVAWIAAARAPWPGRSVEDVNRPVVYARHAGGSTLLCKVDVASDLGHVDRHLFGTNLEWFNEGGGLASSSPELRARLTTLAREAGITAMRYPGGTLADFYHWRDGIGPQASRPARRHPTDPGTSANGFGSPEFFAFLKATGSDGLITVNAGTGTAEEAASWVAYANRPGDAERTADGFREPIGIRDWEIGNELYLPGNPGEQIITVTPQEYVRRYLAFSRAMKAVDPGIRTMAIGVAKAHVGPDTAYPEWSRVLLEGAADEIDVIAVHNAYFPMLDGRRDEPVPEVYAALWAAPEAVDRSLTTLEQLIDRHPTKRPIGIAVTEWGALFSLPHLQPGWFDHVKTMGTGVYVARMLQVLMSHPRVEAAHFFKLTDRSFMGWVDYRGQPKVPYWVFRLYAKFSGDVRLRATVDGPSYDTRAVGNIGAEKQVPEVTVVATRDTATGRIFVNLLNRSQSTVHAVDLDLGPALAGRDGTLLSIGAGELTAHDGRDVAPESPYDHAMEPYSTSIAGGIAIDSRPWQAATPVVLPPFSVATLVLEPARTPPRGTPSP